MIWGCQGGVLKVRTRQNDASEFGQNRQFSEVQGPPLIPKKQIRYIISNDFYCFIWSSFMRGFHWYAFCLYLGWFRGSYVMFNFCHLFSSENISISVPDYHIFIFKKVTKFENCQMCLKLHKMVCYDN